MKKIATLFFFIVLVLFLTQRKIEPVFVEQNNSLELKDHSYYTVNTIDKNVTTLNFSEIFSKQVVIEIEPFINPVYKNKMMDIQKYKFTSASIEDNIYHFIKRYEMNLQNSGFKKEASEVKITGISIQKVTLFSTMDTYIKIQKKIDRR